MAVEAVVFDVGETLIDESQAWLAAAKATDVTPFTLMGVLGGLAARGEHHTKVWEILGVRPPKQHFQSGVWYPDAIDCLARLRERYRVGAVGNMHELTESVVREHVDWTGSSMRWGVEKPAAAFFERVAAETGVAPEKIAYVGDRVDNDVVPVLAAGMVAVHIKRGPWGYLHEPPAAAIRIRSLDELPGAFP
jgi:FMN phosphatase YigB (HAD superfamily)